MTRARIFDGTKTYTTSQEQKIIAFGDLKGRLNYALAVANDLENSGMRYLDEQERFEINDGFIHVFLGNLFDRGEHDRKLARIYKKTREFYKETNNEKVFMLAGNREWAKLRFVSELNDVNIQARIINNDLLNWDAARLSFAEYLVELLYLQKSANLIVKFLDESKVRGIKSSITDRAFEKRFLALIALTTKTNKESNELADKMYQLQAKIKSVVSKDRKLRGLIWRLVKGGLVIEGSGLTSNDENGHSNFLKLLYLHWMLNHTMGCGADNQFKSTFEYRRLELSAERLEEISDAAVMQSFIDDASLLDGAYRNTLLNSIVVLRIDDTLYVHGGLLRDSLIVNDVDYINSDIDEWITVSNSNYRCKAKSIFKGNFDAVFPQICVGNYPHAIESDKNGLAINVFTKRDPNTNKLVPHMDNEVVEFLQKNNITRVVVGSSKDNDADLGFKFEVRGITIVPLNVTLNQEQKICYAKTTSNGENSSCIVRVYDQTLKEAITIDMPTLVIEKEQLDFEDNASELMVANKSLFFATRVQNNDVDMTYSRSRDFQEEAESLLSRWW
jgi:hypothetical protein